MGWRVAGARLDADGQAHFGDRHHQVPLHVHGQRLQRRDVERVQCWPLSSPACRGAARRAEGGPWSCGQTPLRPLRGHLPRKRGRMRKFNQAAKKASQCLAATGRRDQQRALPCQRGFCKFQLVRARRPAARAEPAGERLGQGKCGRMGAVRHGVRLNYSKTRCFRLFFQSCSGMVNPTLIVAALC